MAPEPGLAYLIAGDAMCERKRTLRVSIFGLVLAAGLLACVEFPGTEDTECTGINDDLCIDGLTCVNGTCRDLGGDGVNVGRSCSFDSDCGSELSCDASVPGGYCTLDCLEDFFCPEGSCITFDNDNDGFPDSGFCLASCFSDSTCPRASDSCLDVEGDGFCFPVTSTVP